MEIIRDPRAMSEWSRAARCAGDSLGFVPTMGALHAGHMALCERAREHSARYVASIFVNPTQFAPHEDLAKYPRPFERDADLLRSAGCAALFAPDSAAMYGDGGAQTWVEVPELSELWEGAARPGHLRGVATIVTKLFGICQPTAAYFGEKDWQQLQVVQRLATDFFPDLTIVPCATVREPDGMALSSRNAYLSAEQRAAAQCLSRGIQSAQLLCAGGERDARVLEAALREPCEAEPLARIDYCAVVDEHSLQPLERVETSARALMAVFVGQTRLIDNAQLKA